MRCRQFVLCRRFDNGHARKLRCSVDKLFSLSVAWPRGIDYDILSIARGPAEQIEYRNTVVGIRLAERIAMDVNLGYVWYDCQSCQFGRIR